MASHVQPNILWLMTDEQRTDSLGAYGSPWAHSPNLDRLCRQGVVFENAYTPSPVCQPARESLLTGHYPAQTQVWKNMGRHSLARDYLTHRLIDAGYRSATFGKQHYSGTQSAFEHQESLVISDAVDCYGYAPQYDEQAFGVIKYPGDGAPWVLGGRFPEPAAQKRETEVVNRAVTWLETHPGSAPFLLRLSFSAPHTPVVPPVPFDTIIPEDAIQLPEAALALPENAPAWIKRTAEGRESHRLTGAQIRKARQYYYGETAFVDQQFGRLLDWMEDRGMLDNTIIVFVSDHGTHLGDYGLVQKQTFFEPVVKVPYFFWYPQEICQGMTFHTPVETRTLLPTLLALVGLQVPDVFTGDNLAHALTCGEEPASKPVFSEICAGLNDTRFVMVREGDYKLSMQMDPLPGDGMLVNLAGDPYERVNLFDHPACRDVQARLLASITRHLAGTAVPFANVKYRDPAWFADSTAVACPECGRTARNQRISLDAGVHWTTELSQAYQCSHCGTRFGVRS